MDFQWKQEPEASRLIQDWIAEFFRTQPEAWKIISDIEKITGVRSIDWTDYIVVSGGEKAEVALTQCGFVEEVVPVPTNHRAFHHPGTILPRVLVEYNASLDLSSMTTVSDVCDPPKRSSRAPKLPRSAQSAFSPTALGIKCESVSDVVLAHGLERAITGAPLSPFREAVLSTKNGRELRASERMGYRGFVPVEWSPEQSSQIVEARGLWATRERDFDDASEGMKRTLSIARELVRRVGKDVAASLAFSVERQHWARSNWTGSMVKDRQNTKGLMFANHDHHTFRSSRVHFAALIEILETFGFQNRERFYAGEEAGWGAQVLEQPTAGLVVFADVDLSPQEVLIDFGRQPLPERPTLGTVGLWCQLHGESILQAGLHHVALRVAFDRARNNMARMGVEFLPPFTDFSYLRQAFSSKAFGKNENRSVNPKRIESALHKHFITTEEADRFSKEGAVGSHLEIIERNDGFKGFNQTGVSKIIRMTDPRGDRGEKA